MKAQAEALSQEIEQVKQSQKEFQAEEKEFLKKKKGDLSKAADQVSFSDLARADGDRFEQIFASQCVPLTEKEVGGGSIEIAV